MVEHLVDISLLNVDRRDILSLMGIKDCEPDAITQQMIDDVTSQLYAIAQPKYCYQSIEDNTFQCGKIISEALKDGERYLLVVSTIGERVDEYLHNEQRVNIATAFVADVVASEIAEALQRFALEQIEKSLPNSTSMSNPYSPGYCGWSIREQIKLFDYFDERPCGVSLNDSCLMLPVKSISSIVAIGERVVKAPYGCEICTNANCYKRK